MKEQITTLFGTNSTLWLQGARLAEVGFVPNQTYYQHWYEDRIILSPHPQFVHEGHKKTYTRKVNAQGRAKSEPAIRIEGESIRKLFEGFKNVKATFGERVIVVTGNEREQIAEAA